MANKGTLPANQSKCTGYHSYFILVTFSRPFTVAVQSTCMVPLALLSLRLGPLCALGYLSVCVCCVLLLPLLCCHLQTILIGWYSIGGWSEELP